MSISKIRIWFRAIRPFAYPASIVPVMLGITVAWSEGFTLNYRMAILTIIGTLFAHTGGNLISDYFDFKRGIDRDGALGGSGVLLEKLLSPRDILIASAVSFFIAGVVAHYIILQIGIKLVWLVAGGFIAGLLYSVPPFGFKYGALGELLVFVTFGVGITVGSYVVQAGGYSLLPVWYSIPFGLLVAAILHVNNIRDVETDVQVGVTTLAGMIGPDRSRIIYAGFVIFAYVSLLFFIISGKIVVGSIAAIFTLPMAIGLVLKVWQEPHLSGEECLLMDAKTAKLALLFGLFMIVGIVVWEYLFFRSPILESL
ncbi:MAG: prenyltransferase [Deltaproteobacteria bacterium]|jgi:1,4-dihydroxy-2-naphthoate polyprenyltransferase|nr:prenyltransferase [Deltaproteobacteria bacterium]